MVFVLRVGWWGDGYSRVGVVVVVDGDVVPLETQATVSPPINTAVANPTAAAHRREVLVTNDIPTQPTCQFPSDTGERTRTGCCQRRGGTALGPRVDCA